MELIDFDLTFVLPREWHLQYNLFHVSFPIRPESLDGEAHMLGLVGSDLENVLGPCLSSSIPRMQVW